MQTDPLSAFSPAGAGDPPLRQTGRSLPIALLNAREAVMLKFRPMLARHDLSEQQWRVLRILEEMGELDASELSGRAVVLAPSLTRMIRSLEARALITRRADGKDRRRVLLALAPEGRNLIAEVVPESRAIYQQIEKSFAPADMARLLDLLEDITRRCRA